MFTGIVEEVGIVSSINLAASGASITVQCSKILDDIKIGDSIAINGACQTVVRFDTSGFTVEAAKETLDLTNFKGLKKGTKVNLERAMRADGRFGGHIVIGHVEGIGSFIRKENDGLAELFYFEAPECVAKYLIYKGSVTVNGISLTIASLQDNVFSISVLPLTVKETNLSELKSGDAVNLEPDVLAKYIEKFITKSDNTGTRITEAFLTENGF